MQHIQYVQSISQSFVEACVHFQHFSKCTIQKANSSSHIETQKRWQPEDVLVKQDTQLEKLS